MRFLPTLTPLWEKRWTRFKENRRAFYALWVFLTLLIVSLLAPVLSNDKPLLISYKHELYFPLFKNYPETTFGGDFETTTVYRDPYVTNLIEKNGWMIWPPVRFNYDTVNYDLSVPAPAPPSAQNWLGTDDQGRDLLARLLYGFRLTLLFCIALTFGSTLIGLTIGAIQGYLGGLADLTLQRVTEIWAGLPILYVLMILSSIIEPNFWWLLGILLLFKWIVLVGVVRAEFLRARNLDYVRAAKMLGVGTPRIIMRHVLPNALIATLTFIPFLLNASITTLTTLDFLGFGLPPGSPSLGEVLTQGKNNLHAPWIGISVFITLSLTLTLVTFIGEGVRDAFDPRKLFKSRKEAA